MKLTLPYSAEPRVSFLTEGLSALRYEVPWNLKEFVPEKGLLFKHKTDLLLPKLKILGLAFFCECVIFHGSCFQLLWQSVSGFCEVCFFLKTENSKWNPASVDFYLNFLPWWNFILADAAQFKFHRLEFWRFFGIKNILSSQDWGRNFAAYSLGMYMAALWINTCQTLLLWNSCEVMTAIYFILLLFFIWFHLGFGKGESTGLVFPIYVWYTKSPLGRGVMLTEIT